MEQYKGNVRIEKKLIKTKPNFARLGLWLCGLILSLIPTFADIVVYLGNSGNLDYDYWLHWCVKGDALWILATVLILSLMEYFSSDTKQKPKWQLVLACFGLIIFCICVVVWCLFRYCYPETYSGKFPVYVNLILSALIITLSGTLQIDRIEVVVE